MFQSFLNIPFKFKGHEKINGIYIISIIRAVGKCKKYLCYPPVGQKNYKNKAHPFLKHPVHPYQNNLTGNNHVRAMFLAVHKS